MPIIGHRLIERVTETLHAVLHRFRDTPYIRGTQVHF